MNLDFLQHQKMKYSFLKKEHFVPSVQIDDLAIWLSFEWITW